MFKGPRSFWRCSVGVCPAKGGNVLLFRTVKGMNGSRGGGGSGFLKCLLCCYRSEISSAVSGALRVTWEANGASRSPFPSSRPSQEKVGDSSGPRGAAAGPQRGRHPRYRCGPGLDGRRAEGPRLRGTQVGGREARPRPHGARRLHSALPHCRGMGTPGNRVPNAPGPQEG